MNDPTKVSTQWKKLAATSDIDDDGVTLHTSLHIMEINSGEDFVVTITGRGKADSAYWIGAISTALGVWKQAAGEPLPINMTLVPPAKQH